ncbi:NLR family CARD domain-containing protein 3-like [Astyanax mexicanus]|uniref:NLR family CARD domain-containing protein 3-like n=1 Tax=Astyanax mexicanus TaxID=7994 RepID=UPI0020CACFBD|nr:NLR family CARD domain-containing protein 3-like [Astyanax mexicanus]
MKSDWSMDLPLKFNDEDPSPEHRSDQSSAETKYCENFKLNLKKKFQCLHEVITNQENTKLLNEIYTELYITEGGSGEINKEHEVRQMEAASRSTLTEETTIECSDLFTPLSEQDKPIRTVLTTGVAGIGKTVSVQKFILDWAEGKANQDLHFIFPLPFRELNLMKDQKLSLMDLLHECFKETKEMEISSSHKALFIFDGLDESRLALDFQNGVNLCDVTESASVEVLLMNLMKGNLLPSALIWITSRPAAADQIPSECVDRVTEVRGFSDPQKEEYFRKRISDQSLADKTIKHLKTSRSLYIMCQIPVFCWISATVLEKILNEAQNREIPKTLTEMYTHFIIIQTQIIREKYQKNQQHTDEEMLLKLGQLAFQQLMKGNLIFYDEDLKECGIDIREALLYSGVCTQIFREESELLHSKVFCFVHLSIQEHLAALYVHLTFMNRKKNVLKQNYSSKLRVLLRTELSLSHIHKSAVHQALQSQNGHLDLFVRFLLGLSLESNQILLQSLEKHRESSIYNKEKTVQYIKTKIGENPPTEKSICLFHCLNELGDNSLVKEIQQYLQSGGLKARTLSPSQWSAVVFVLHCKNVMTSEVNMDEFILERYGSSDKVLHSLLPVVAQCRTANLKDCKLTEKSCADLVSILSSKSSTLQELDMSWNNVGDSGVKLLSAGLKNSHCKLEILRLQQCNITDEGCTALASALKSVSSCLRKLDLYGNDQIMRGRKLLLDLQTKGCYRLQEIII